MQATPRRGGAAGMGARDLRGGAEPGRAPRPCAITPAGAPPSTAGPAARGFESRLPCERGGGTPPWAWAPVSAAAAEGFHGASSNLAL